MAHVIQASTDLDDNVTVVSVDGVGAFDLITRNSMLSGLMGMREGEQLLPIAKLFYGDPSTYLWEDEVGDVHHLHQGEGGEQGDALMPMLFCLGQHGALRAIAERLLPGEKLFAYLDDLYVVCQPDRVGDVHTIIGQELWRHAKISVHHGKTKVWNRGGTCPDACAALTEAARMVDLRAVVWRGDTSLPR